MGRDLLGQDYILKQITASLIYPEKRLGQKFWDKIYQRAYKEYGTTNVPVDTFNKVWIIPDQAIVYESGNFPACLDLALTSADFAGFPARRERARAEGR